MINSKRQLPRHVDGRIMIANIPLKKFFIFLPICILIVVIISNIIRIIKSPVVFVGGTVVITFTYCMFAEISYKETGLDVIKEMIKYQKEGDVIYERRPFNESVK